MTYEEAMIQISFIKNFGYPQDIAMLSKEVNGDKYRALKMAIEALKKQILMKPIFKELDYYCPTCGKYVEQGRRCAKIACGQAIDWSEE